MNHLEESKSALDRVLNLTEKDVPLANIPKYAAFIVRAEWLLAAGRLEESQRALEPTLQAARVPNGSLRTLLGSSQMTAFKIAMARHRFGEAVNWATQALEEETLRSRTPDMSADVGEAELYLAPARRALGDAEGARQAARQASITLTRSLGPDCSLTQAAALLAATDMT